MLTIKCNRHPRYKAQNRPIADCDGCRLLYAIRWQWEKLADLTYIFNLGTMGQFAQRTKSKSKSLQPPRRSTSPSTTRQ